MNPGLAGYSGTPLARKLGIVEGSFVVARRAPAEYLRWIEPLPPGVVFEKSVSNATDIVHVFSDRTPALKSELGALRHVIRKDAAV